MMYELGQKQMTPNPIKTKENDGINHCQECEIIVIRPLKGENTAFQIHVDQKARYFFFSLLSSSNDVH